MRLVGQAFLPAKVFPFATTHRLIVRNGVPTRRSASSPTRIFSISFNRRLTDRNVCPTC